MKILFVAFTLLAAGAVSAQTLRADLAKQPTNADRRTALDALRRTLQPDLGLSPKMVVNHLYVLKGFAFFTGEVRNAQGGPVDFTKTQYREAQEAGAFDGPSTVALLKKSGKGWKVLTYAIGPTDVAWACWWKEHNAPKELFDYAESCE